MLNRVMHSHTLRILLKNAIEGGIFVDSGTWFVPASRALLWLLSARSCKLSASLQRAQLRMKKQSFKLVLIHSLPMIERG